MSVVVGEAAGESAAADDDGYWSRGVFSRALADVAVAVDRLAGLDLSVPGTAETLDGVRAVERQLRRLQGISVRLIGQIEQRGLAAPAGATSTTVLRRQILNIGTGDAFERVRLAGVVCPTVGGSGTPVEPELPVLAGAVAAGVLGQRQAARIASTFGKFPATVGQDLRDSVERFLVEQGMVLEPVTLGRLARQIELMADPDGSIDERDAHEKMQFRFGQRRDNGLTPCWGLLDDLTAEALRAAFGAICAPAANRDGDGETPKPDGAAQPGKQEQKHHEPVGVGNADSDGNGNGDAHGDGNGDADGDTVPASVNIDPRPVWRAGRVPYEWAPLGTVTTDYPPQPQPPGTKKQASDPGQLPDPGPPGPPGDRRSKETRQAQALTIIVNKFLAFGLAPIQGGERPHLQVTISEQSLRDRTRAGVLGYGDHLPIEQVRMFACDARIIPAVFGGKSATLNMGRAMRSFNAACRRAVLTRDVGCVFPGCHIRGLWAEYHHIHHWADGGPSDYTNAALLCRRHHTLIHHGQWHIRLAPDGQPEIIPPTTHDPTRQPLHNTLHKPPEFEWPPGR